MKMFVVFVILLHVSQHALAVVVEVYEEAKSVLLPCQYSGIIPENNPTVMWTRSDLSPTFVHLRREEGDDLKKQNLRYSGRTSMRPDALETSDFSLTLTKPELIDSGVYTCSISDGKEETGQRNVQLKVKDQQVEIRVEEGSDSVILPCQTRPDLPGDTSVEWARSDRELMMVHVYPNRSENLKKQDDLYCGRTKMNEDLLRTGDLSVTLKYPTERDSGGYICTIYRDKDILRQKVVLQVKEPFPSWAIALIVLMVLLVLLVFGGLLFNFRYYFKSVPQVVEVVSGQESVQLPYKAKVHLLEDTKVEWIDSDNDKVHVYQNGTDHPNEQDQVYRERTKMKEGLLKTGDFSLTLKYPKERDTKTYTCTVFSTKGNVLMKKQVVLHVKVPEVEVDSGVEFVQLSCQTAVHSLKEAKVEWTDKENRKVSVYQNTSDLLALQHRFFRNRTKINDGLLKTGDLSLTLKYPTDWDRGIYTCTVYNRYRKIRMKKEVELKVRGTLLFLRGSTCASSPLSSTCYSEGTSSMMEELLESAESFLQSETSVTVQRIYGSRDLHGH
ncbi:hypothetical protein ACER0C_002643 [Sarotherodon galilaeus]